MNIYLNYNYLIGVFKCIELNIIHVYYKVLYLLSFYLYYLVYFISLIPIFPSEHINYLNLRQKGIILIKVPVTFCIMEDLIV